MKRRDILILTIALLVADQIVKVLVKTHMTIDQHFMVFGEWFQIRFIENPGAAYGFQFGGDYGKLFLSVFRLAAIGVLAWYLNRLVGTRANRGVLIGFTLIFAGAIGNIVDSAFYGLIFSESTYTSVAGLFPEGGGYGTFLHGKVVDMLYFPIIKSTYPQWFPFVGGEDFTFFSPIFNFADSYISVGAIYLILFKRKFFLK